MPLRMLISINKTTRLQGKPLQLALQAGKLISKDSADAFASILPMKQKCPVIFDSQCFQGRIP